VGGLLGMRPLLTVRAGRVEVAGTVRTRRAARDRLIGAVVDDVARRPHARVAVHHLGRPETGAELADDVAGALRARVDERAGSSPATGGAVEVVVADVSAVVGAHAGPGLLGVVVGEP
jgi:fatty acid-binding protein DegV